MKLRQVVASSCRQRILLALSKVKRTHITNLVRITGSTYDQIDRNVRILETEGLVKTKSVGRMRIIELQTENLKTQTVLKALRSLIDSDEHSRDRVC